MLNIALALSFFVAEKCSPFEIGCYNIFTIERAQEIIDENGEYLRNDEADVYFTNFLNEVYND